MQSLCPNARSSIVCALPRGLVRPVCRDWLFAHALRGLENVHHLFCLLANPATDISRLSFVSSNKLVHDAHLAGRRFDVFWLLRAACTPSAFTREAGRTRAQIIAHVCLSVDEERALATRVLGWFGLTDE